MYVFTLNRNSLMEEDIQALKKISETHRSDPLDLVIIESFLQCPVLEKYCTAQKIQIAKVPETLARYHAIISEYQPQNPAHLTRKSGKELENLIATLGDLNISTIIC